MQYEWIGGGSVYSFTDSLPPLIIIGGPASSSRGPVPTNHDPGPAVKPQWSPLLQVRFGRLYHTSSRHHVTTHFSFSHPPSPSVFALTVSALVFSHDPCCPHCHLVEADCVIRFVVPISCMLLCLPLLLLSHPSSVWAICDVSEASPPPI